MQHDALEIGSLPAPSTGNKPNHPRRRYNLFVSAALRCDGISKSDVARELEVRAPIAPARFMLQRASRTTTIIESPKMRLTC